MLFFMATNISSRDGVYYFRARIPTHLISAFGRSFVSISLRTRDPQEAKVRARARRVELDNALRALEQGGSGPDPESGGTVLYMSDQDVQAFCNRYVADILASDELDRIKGLSPLDHKMSIDIWSSVLPRMKSEFARGVVSELVLDELSMQMKARGLLLSKSTPSFERLALAFQQAQLRGYEARLRRLHGEDVPLPVQVSSGLSLDDVLNAWKKQKGGNLKTARSFEQAFEAFKASCPTNNATLVRKADAVAFRNKLQEEGSSAATVRKLLGFLRAGFQVTVDDDLLPINPFAGVKTALPKTSAVEKSRLPFTSDELKKIFNGPVYQPGFKPRPSIGTAVYWLPLLGLFTGARLEELAQLEANDIKHDPVHGAYVCVRRAVDGSKRAKNLNSIRNFPVHPRLIAVGFLDYVASMKGGRLFPALKADKYGTLSTVYSTYWGRFLEGLGIADKTKVFHSFRHTFVQRAKECAASVPPEVREAIVGHFNASSIEATYGTSLYPLEPQVSAMKAIDWPELDLTHLYPSALTS